MSDDWDARIDALHGAGAAQAIEKAFADGSIFAAVEAHQDDSPDRPAMVTVRLDDLRQVLDAATSNPYLGDDGLGLDYLSRLEAVAAEADDDA